jgi:hypothetical protein
MRVVQPLDEFEHRPTRLVPHAEAITIQQLTLQRGEEALAQGVVVAVPHGSHRRSDAGFLAALSEGDRRVKEVLSRREEIKRKTLEARRHQHTQPLMLAAKPQVHPGSPSRPWKCLLTWSPDLSHSG